MNFRGRLPVPDERLRFAFLLGAIFPDTLFYDIPAFGLSSIGTVMHHFQGEAGLDFFREWLREEGPVLPDDIRAWMLGFTGHLLSDGFWHPAIDRLCGPRGGLRRRLGLSPGSCHHWVESELEACWVGRVGAPDGYAALLERFHKEKGITRKYVTWFRRFLERAGVERVPRESDIARCLGRQTLLLTEFARPRWARWRPRLLQRRRGQYLGALLVPEVPELPAYAEDSAGASGNETICGGVYLARAVTSLAERLSELPIRF